MQLSYLFQRSNLIFFFFIVVSAQAIGLNQAWEHKLAEALSHMEHSHLSTLVYIVQ